jgi:hypothetical protein
MHEIIAQRTAYDVEELKRFESSEISLLRLSTSGSVKDMKMPYTVALGTYLNSLSSYNVSASKGLIVPDFILTGTPLLNSSFTFPQRKYNDDGTWYIPSTNSTTKTTWQNTSLANETVSTPLVT